MAPQKKEGGREEQSLVRSLSPKWINFMANLKCKLHSSGKSFVNRIVLEGFASDWKSNQKTFLGSSQTEKIKFFWKTKFTVHFLRFSFGNREHKITASSAINLNETPLSYSLKDPKKEPLYGRPWTLFLTEPPHRKWTLFHFSSRYWKVSFSSFFFVHGKPNEVNLFGRLR